MIIRALIEVSQDNRNWTVRDLEWPAPTDALRDYAYFRVKLMYQAETGEADVLAFPPPPRERHAR